MLEGLEISVLKLSELERTSRFDTEFYAKHNLVAIDTIQKLGAKSLANYFSVSDGNHMSISEQFSTDGIPYYRGGDIYNFFIEHTQQPLKIPKVIYELSTMKRSHLKKGDLLVSIVGAIIGNLSIVTTEQLATCSCKLAILRPKNIQSEFAAIFFKSKYGQSQIQKFRRGTGQTGLILEDFDQLLLPIFSEVFRNLIVQLVDNSFKTISGSKQTYNQAEQLLLQELGITETLWQTKGLAINNKSFKESFADSGRLDAEYYQPKYDEIIKLIRSYSLGSTNLKTLVNDYSTGFPFNSDSYVNEGVSLIRINNIKKGELDISNAAKIPNADILLSPKDVVKENDLLISMSGTIGSCCKITANTKAIINQRILRFSIKNFNVDVLCLYINSIFGELQLERVGTGGVQTNISTSDIFNIELPLLDEVIQQQIASLIQQSFQLRKQSKHLLEIAKQAVEMAIETDEVTAIKFIRANTES